MYYTGGSEEMWTCLLRHLTMKVNRRGWMGSQGKAVCCHFLFWFQRWAISENVCVLTWMVPWRVADARERAQMQESSPWVRMRRNTVGGELASDRKKTENMRPKEGRFPDFMRWKWGVSFWKRLNLQWSMRPAYQYGEGWWAAHEFKEWGEIIK